MTDCPLPNSTAQENRLSRTGVLLIVSAPSGTGKSTLIHKLRTRHPEINFSISCTTRAPRQGEQHGRDYFFLDKDEFLSRREKGYFAEWAEVHGNYYGTPLAHVEELRARGQDLLFDIDVQGALQLQKSLPQAVSVFLFPPSLEELKKRLLLRKTETTQTLQKRLSGAKNEIAQAHHFDYYIINDDLEKAAGLLEAVYLAQTVKKNLAADTANILLQNPGYKNG